MDFQSLKNRYGIVGRDEALDEALKIALQVAPTDLSVLIEGENGVGKEVLPRIIHDYSHYKKGPYIAINCGSIPEGTIDSELFGHEKGAFTTAISDHVGYFGTANEGTLFLDEVGELPMSTQARLLRVLETGEFMRVGSSKVEKTTARIVAATNVNIPNAIKEGKFRQDLYYRLCRVNINIPPLRNRGNDAILLFKKFAIDIATKYKMDDYIHLTPEAEDVIKSYKWPGNIRQLKNLAEQLSVLSQERIITPQILAKHNIVPNATDETGITTTANYRSESHRDYENEIKMLARAVLELKNDVEALKQQMKNGDMHSTVPTTMPAPTSVPTQVAPSLRTTTVAAEPHHIQASEIQTAEEVMDEETLNIMDMEKKNIIKALQRNHYKRKLAADELGISERTLYRKIKAYSIDE